ncbi:hypothetical protein GQ457_16G012800 [Hibiscus cannabinus]
MSVVVYTLFSYRKCFIDCKSTISLQTIRYIKKLEETVGHEKAKTIISNSLILVSMSKNEIRMVYFLLHSLYNIIAYMTQLVNSTSSFTNGNCGLSGACARKHKMPEAVDVGAD